MSFARQGGLEGRQAGWRFAIGSVHIGAPASLAELSSLSERLGVLIAGRNVDLITCDVRALTDADTSTVDGLARLQLSARRLGIDIRLLNACEELRTLLAVVGLCEVVGACVRQPLVRTRGAAGGRRAGTCGPYRGRR
ncbi:MAG: STAS domain-containing protein [Chloroflexota bacterium]|nr:STAS domain-containing protein [Chloroflexota bacterium]